MSLPFYIGSKIIEVKINSLRQLVSREPVAILKIDGEKQNHCYITNGFISVDADCRR